MTVNDPHLLERLRARLRAGDTVTEAARALGVTPDRAQGLIRRHGRGEPPSPASPAPELPGPKPGCCAWPEGEKPRIRFECRNPPQPGLSYCAEHCRRAFITVRVRTGLPIIMPRLGTAL